MRQRSPQALQRHRQSAGCRELVLPHCGSALPVPCQRPDVHPALCGKQSDRRDRNTADPAARSVCGRLREADRRQKFHCTRRQRRKTARLQRTLRKAFGQASACLPYPAAHRQGGTGPAAYRPIHSVSPAAASCPAAPATENAFCGTTYSDCHPKAPAAGAGAGTAQSRNIAPTRCHCRKIAAR